MAPPPGGVSVGMSTYALEGDPDSLRDRFDTSKVHVAGIAYRLISLGFGVHVDVQRVRQEGEDHLKFAKSKDIIVWGTKRDADGRALKKVIEGKGKDVKFTNNPASWPFDDATLYTDNKTYEPDAVVICSSRNRPDLVVVTRDGTWTKRSQIDRRRNNHTYIAVVSPVTSLMTWRVFTRALWLSLMDDPYPEVEPPEPDDGILAALDSSVG
jgi:hypothetical protein